MDSHDQAGGDADRLQIAPPAVSRLPLVAMGALVALAILVAIALGLRGPAEFDPGTPEATVQSYLQAVLDGDEEAVLALVVSDQVPECRREFERYGSYPMDGVGFELESMIVTGDTARAELVQRSTSGGPFDGTRRYGDNFVELRKEAGEWRVATASWPWRFDTCLEAS